MNKVLKKMSIKFPEINFLIKHCFVDNDLRYASKTMKALWF